MMLSHERLVSRDHMMLVRPLKVVAFICCCVALLLLIMSLLSSDWLLSDNWRQGLFTRCVAPVGCQFPPPLTYAVVSQVLSVASLTLNILATVLTAAALYATARDAIVKRRCYRAATACACISLPLLLTALLVFPMGFARHLPSDSDRLVWHFGWAYGVGWGGAIFVCGACVLLLCDKETQELYYKERTVVVENRF